MKTSGKRGFAEKTVGKLSVAHQPFLSLWFRNPFSDSDIFPYTILIFLHKRHNTDRMDLTNKEGITVQTVC